MVQKMLTKTIVVHKNFSCDYGSGWCLELAKITPWWAKPIKYVKDILTNNRKDYGTKDSSTNRN